MKAFVTLFAAYLILLVISEYILVSDDLVIDFLAKRLSYERANEFMEEQNNWKWLTSIFVPISILFKLFFVTFCIYIGELLLGIENTFTSVFIRAINAEFIFLIPPVIKLFWFTFLQTDYTLETLEYFSPFSLFSLFNPNEVDPWLTYPLKLVNAFELLYWLALAYQLKEVLHRGFLGSLGFVASTYGAGLLIWVVLVMFLSLSMS